MSPYGMEKHPIKNQKYQSDFEDASSGRTKHQRYDAPNECHLRLK